MIARIDQRAEKITKYVFSATTAWQEYDLSVEGLTATEENRCRHC